MSNRPNRSSAAFRRLHHPTCGCRWQTERAGVMANQSGGTNSRRIGAHPRLARNNSEIRNPKSEMKFALIIPDGGADEPQSSLAGRTPLQAARTPHMDQVVQLGVVGRSDNVPASMP